MSSNQLAIYEKMDQPLVAIEQMGNWIFNSGMIALSSKEAGAVVALTCMSEGIDVIQFIRTYHIIKGKPSMRADAMLAEFRTKKGGDHEVVEASPDRAAIKLTPKNGKPVEFSFSWEEAKQSRWPWADKERTRLKDNWSTPVDRRDMLWARCVSAALRKVCPEVVAGIYTPEEMMDEPVNPKNEPIDPDEILRRRREEEEANASEGDVVDAEYVVTTESEPEQPKQVAGQLFHGKLKPQDSDGSSTIEQRDEIKSLFGALDWEADRIQANLRKLYDIEAIRQLSQDQASDLLERLTKKLAGKSRIPDDTTTQHETGAVDQVLVDQIKSLIRGDKDTAQQIKKFLVTNGMSQLADMCHRDAVSLKNAIESRQMEDFFTRSLEQPTKGKEGN